MVNAATVEGLYPDAISRALEAVRRGPTPARIILDTTEPDSDDLYHVNDVLSSADDVCAYMIHFYTLFFP